MINKIMLTTLFFLFLLNISAKQKWVDWYWDNKLAVED